MIAYTQPKTFIFFLSNNRELLKTTY